ncbi:MAG: hypothetical protein AAF441_04410 [Pseudomonadota bacterium]
MAIHVFDDRGALVQRLDIIEPDDTLILAAATSSHPLWTGSAGDLDPRHFDPRCESNVISLMPQFSRGKNWKLLPFHEHLDHIIADGGNQRHRRLMSLGREEARRIDTKVLPHLLDYLATQNRSFTRIFVRKTIAQAHQGPVHMIDVVDDVLMAYSKKTVAALDMQSIGKAWLVPYAAKAGSSSSLEIYDRTGACLAIFLSEQPNACMAQIDWDDLMFSLPGER